MKERFSRVLLEKTTAEQRAILVKAAKSVKPGGHLVYATCSVLQEENEEQAAWIEGNLPFSRVGEFLKTSPDRDEMDGFFGAVFKKAFHIPD